MPSPVRSFKERLAEQSALMEKAQSRVNELEYAQVIRLQRIAKRVGFFSVEVSDACIEQALQQAMERASTTNDPETGISEKQRREARVFQQNRARVERAKRSIQRLKKEERRRDASQKWQLGNLLEMAGIASITIEALDEKLSVIHAGLAKSGVRERWQARGFELLQQQKDGSAKNVSGYSASRGINPVRADAHRKITLGGLVKKHRLESLSPALLLGALIDLKQ